MVEELSQVKQLSLNRVGAGVQCRGKGDSVFSPSYLEVDKRSYRWYFKTFKEPRNRFQGIDSAKLCSLMGRYDNPIPTRFLAPIGCSKIPALGSFTKEKDKA
jgi:hypothetical protein